MQLATNKLFKANAKNFQEQSLHTPMREKYNDLNYVTIGCRDCNSC